MLIKTTDAFNGTQPVATNFYGLGGDAGIMNCVHIKWGALFAGTITIEVSNFPEVLLASAVAGEWSPDNNAPAGTTEVSTTTGGVWTAKTLVVTAGQIGSAWLKLADAAFARYRIKVVCTAADALRISATSKE